MRNDSGMNLSVFDGDSDHYHSHRIEPPSIVVDIIKKILVGNSPGRVVDLGCGTGLATIPWAKVADEVIGIEPNASMRDQALGEANVGNVRITDGNHSDMGLPDGSVDIVTCSQSLHWMEPGPAHKEIVRVLRKGGVLAAFGYDMPPLINLELSKAYDRILTDAQRMIKEEKLWEGLKIWPFTEQLKHMDASGLYCYVNQILFHQIKAGNCEDFMGLVRSYGGIHRALKKGASSSELGLDDLQGLAEKTIGSDPVEWILSYKMIVGVK